jgi:hypothetical protein
MWVDSNFILYTWLYMVKIEFCSPILPWLFISCAASSSAIQTKFWITIRHHRQNKLPEKTLLFFLSSLNTSSAISWCTHSQKQILWKLSSTGQSFHDHCVFGQLRCRRQFADAHILKRESILTFYGTCTRALTACCEIVMLLILKHSGWVS